MKDLFGLLIYIIKKYGFIIVVAGDAANLLI